MILLLILKIILIVRAGLFYEPCNRMYLVCVDRTLILKFFQKGLSCGVVLVGFLQDTVESFDNCVESEVGAPVVFEDWHGDYSWDGVDVEMIDLIEENKAGGLFGIVLIKGEFNIEDHMRVLGICSLDYKRDTCGL